MSNMKRKTKEKKLKIIWKQAKGVSEEESQRIWDMVFDILLGEEVKKQDTTS